MNISNIIAVDMETATSKIIVSAIYQYDRGLKLRLLNAPESDEFTLWVEMCNSGDAVINNTVQYTGDDVELPEELLLNGRDVEIYLFIKGDGWGKTIMMINVRIDLRPST